MTIAVARRRARARERGLSVPVDARQLRRFARRRLHRLDAEPRRRRPDRLLRRDGAASTRCTCSTSPSRRRRGGAATRAACSPSSSQLAGCARRGRLWLEVRESNAQARDAYRRLGFAPVGPAQGLLPGARRAARGRGRHEPRRRRRSEAPMRWTERQRAMLREMGIQLWAPRRRAGGAAGGRRAVAEARRRAGAARRAERAADAAAPRRRARVAEPAAPRLPGAARRADWLVVGEPLDAADPQQAATARQHAARDRRRA